MDLFLLHSLILIWSLLGAARRLERQVATQLLVAGLLAWGNLVATSLLLSMAHRLGERGWFFGVSMGLAGLTCLLLRKSVPEATVADEGKGPNRWLLGSFWLTLVPALAASTAAAFCYAPNNADALAFQLPRAMYYLGQGSLAHFATGDPRQTLLPFNHELIQLLGLVYSSPLPALNFFNLAAWVLCGLAVHCLCRQRAFSANASLVACWFVLMIPTVLAQAASTTPELAVGAALCSTLLFAQRWRQNGRVPDALLAGLAAGLAAGSDWRALVLILAAGLVALAVNFRRGTESGRIAFRVWRAPLLLAVVAGLPFALINLATPDPAALSLRGMSRGLATLQGWLQSSDRLNENICCLDAAGGLFLLAAFAALGGKLKPAATSAWWAGGWILAALLVPAWSPAGPRDLVPAFLLLGPAVAGLIDFLSTRGADVRNTGWAIILAVALLTGWSSWLYLLNNESRPCAPLLHHTPAPPALPRPPLLVEYHLSRQTRINVDSNGVDQRMFAFMGLRPDQHFTSRRELDPGAYNLISRSTQSFQSNYAELAGKTAYVTVFVPGKPTAGVEFLATVGRDSAARDYFGLEADANHTPSVPGNRSLLVTLSTEPSSGSGRPKTRIRLAGLNPADGACLRVNLKLADYSIEQVGTFTADGEIFIAPTKPFAWLVFQAVDKTTGRELGAAALPYLAPASAAAGPPTDPSRPSGPGSAFVMDLVLARETMITTEGLTPVEGPFPQWDLPYVRWARAPVVRLRIMAGLSPSRLQVAFSVRTHVRPKAVLEIFFNGSRVGHYQLEGRTTWLEQKLELVPQAGENVLEFRDASGVGEPDWLDYLARYPDVKAYLVASGRPLESGAREHFELHGRAEGRTVQLVAQPEAVPDSFYFMFRHLRIEGFNPP